MNTILTFPDCKISQLVDKSTIPMGAGELSLIQNPTALPGEPSLSFKLNELVFPLTKDHPIYTHVKNPQWYFFETPVSKGSYIQVELPQAITADGSDDQKLRDNFEDELIKAGLLKAGIEAVGDELGASVKQDATALSETISATVKSHTSSRPATTSPTTFSPTTHSIVEGAEVNTGKASSFANSAAESFTNVAVGVGEKVVKMFGGTTAIEEEMNHSKKLEDDLREAGYPVDGEDTGPSTLQQTGEAIKSAYSGISEATSTVKSAAANGTSTIIDHDYGADAAKLAGQTGQSIDNVGNVLGQLGNATSVPYQVGRAAVVSNQRPVVPESEVYTV